METVTNKEVKIRNKTISKMLALLLAGVMVAGLLTGCSSSSSDSEEAEETVEEEEEEVEEEAAEEEAEEEAEVEEEAEAEEEEETEEEEAATGTGMDSWVAFEENVLLQIPVYDRGVEGIPDVSDNYWTNWVQTEFGDVYNITVEYVPITRTDVMTDYALLAAAGDLPTLLGEYDFPKLAQWASEGYLTSFDMDEFAEIAPTYYGNMESNGVLSYSLMNGENYFVLGQLAYYNTNYSWQTFWRMDWLEEVGYDHVPATREEYVDALTKIKEAGICEYPAGGSMITGVGSDQNHNYRDYPMDEEEWAMYGDYNIVSLGWEPNYLLLKDANEDYNNGLTNPEYYVTDTDTAQANFIMGESAFYGMYIAADMPVLTSFYEQNPDATLAIQPADVVYGTSNAYRSNNPFGFILGFSSSATDDEIKAAMMYLEWMSQDDVFFTMQFGIEGENFDYDEDGLPVTNSDYDGDAKQGYNNNNDYWCVVWNGSRVSGTVETTIASTLPNDLPQDFTDEVVDYYYTRVDMAAEGLAIVDCIFTVSIDAESEYSGTLTELYKEYRDALTMCDPDEFDALYEEDTQKYLDAGYQAVIDERLEAYQNGNSTTLN